MTDPGMDLGFLTRRHAIKIDSKLSVETLSLAIGELVGHENVLSASRMNNVVVCFLRTIDMANAIVECGLVIDGQFITALPLSMPSKKVMVSNVPPFISDAVLLDTLSRYGKIVSPIRKIAIASKSPLLKHVVSFRRSVYMICKELELKLNVKVDNFNYEIYVTTDTTMKCLGCGQMGHFRRDCLKTQKAIDNVLVTTAEAGGETDKAGAIEVEGAVGVVDDAVGDKPGAAQTEANGDGMDIQVATNDVLDFDAQPCPSAATSGVVNGERSADNVLNDKDDPEQASSVDPADTQVSQPSVDPPSSGETVADDEESIATDADFKEPPKTVKRKSTRSNSSANKAKKPVTDPHKSDIESENEASDCSITCSLALSGYPGQLYSADDIKSFLAKTKRAKHVRIDHYFPNVELFVEQTTKFIAQGCFVNNEVARLKRILGKLKTLLVDNVPS